MYARVPTNRHDSVIDQYITFCRIFDQQIRRYGKTEKAVRESLRICRDRNGTRRRYCSVCSPHLKALFPGAVRRC